jgi:hypothetical protein
VHSSTNLARKYEVLKEAHETLKLEAARDKASLAGERFVRQVSQAIVHSIQVGGFFSGVERKV